VKGFTQDDGQRMIRKSSFDTWIQVS